LEFWKRESQELNNGGTIMKDFAASRCLIFAVVTLALPAPATAQNVKIKMGAASSPPILDTITSLFWFKRRVGPRQLLDLTTQGGIKGIV
jgi:hypothetical protein